jgi:hypothetical protein
MISSNSDLAALLDTLIASRTAEWVMGHQPVDWRPQTWKASWKVHGSPCSHVLDELEAEITAHGTIRRSFIFSTYQDRRAIELFIAAMAWGSGTSGRSLARIRVILGQPNAADKIQATVDAVRLHGAAAGYRGYFSYNRLSQLDVAFATKLLYFAGYQHQHLGQPRPLIYDTRVATAITRLPAAPLLPTIPDSVTTSKYERYCAWAEAIAEERQTEPVVIEWALFALGGDIRNELRR